MRRLPVSRGHARTMRALRSRTPPGPGLCSGRPFRRLRLRGPLPLRFSARLRAALTRKTELQVVGETNGKRKNHQCRIGMTAGREHRATGNVHAGDAMNLTVCIYRAAFRINRHAGGAEYVSHIYDDSIIGALFVYPVFKDGGGNPTRVNSPTMSLARRNSERREASPMRQLTRASGMPNGSILSESVMRLSRSGACSDIASTVSPSSLWGSPDFDIRGQRSSDCSRSVRL